VNTAAIENPSLIAEASRRFGAQCVVVSIDFRCDPDGTARVFTHGARERTDLTVLELAQRVVQDGAGELLLTDADRDGMGSGLNVEVCAAVAERVGVPIILGGGCGRAEHFVDGFRLGNAEAVAAGTFFSFRDQNPIQTRAHVKNAGIAVRMET
jgi:cyclase